MLRVNCLFLSIFWENIYKLVLNERFYYQHLLQFLLQQFNSLIAIKNKKIKFLDNMEAGVEQKHW